MVFVKVNVGQKGQIVIPKVFRDAFGIVPGSEVIVEEKQQELVVRKPAVEIAEFLRKVAKSGPSAQVDVHTSYDEMMEKRLKHVLPRLRAVHKRRR